MHSAHIFKLSSTTMKSRNYFSWKTKGAISHTEKKNLKTQDKNQTVAKSCKQHCQTCSGPSCCSALSSHPVVSSDSSSLMLWLKYVLLRRFWKCLQVNYRQSSDAWPSNEQQNRHFALAITYCSTELKRLFTMMITPLFSDGTAICKLTTSVG